MVSNATFLSKPVMPLNPGPVGIIGARGSGKTALADFIAIGAGAFSLHSNRLSLIDRAREHLAGTRVDLGWGDETGSGTSIDDLGRFGDASDPYVRYLSQQFVDRLCSAEGMTDELVAEQDHLRALYAPLTARIEAESGSARKLAFIVRRRVDVEQGGEWGEQPLDLRKGSTLRRGTLAELATRLLLPAWSAGTPELVTQALAQFRESYDNALTECCPYNLRDPGEAAKVRQWAGQISAWLYGTSHIEIAYGVQYEGTDVERLSPGTRGIVLLLLYLAIDLDDSRPLLIDQPEGEPRSEINLRRISRPLPKRQATAPDHHRHAQR